MEAGLQRSLADLEDIRSNQVSSSHANGLLDAGLNFRRGAVEDIDSRSESPSQENVHLRRALDERNGQVRELIRDQDRLRRNANSWDNHARHLQEELDQQLEETMESKSHVERLEAALDKKEKLAITVAEFLESECRTMQASVARMSRVKSMIESSLAEDREARDDVSGFSSEEEE